MRHAGALRNFASTLRELARRGHQVHLAFAMRDEESERGVLQALVADCPSITHERVKMQPHRWSALARTVRSAADYARYRQPEFAAARPLRKRASRHVSPWLQQRIDRRAVASPDGIASLMRLRARLEQTLPVDPRIRRFVAGVNPDVVLVTPLIDLASDQVEYVKAARALGIPSGLCVHSWDNLTNKGLIHVAPDRVFVWNAVQQREAVTFHGIEPAHVVATGAPVFDSWFARKPSTTRAEFCAKVGLPAERPIVLYLCSSRFIAATEADFIVKWITAIRSAHDARVRDAGLLIRPHPNTILNPPQQAAWRDVAGVTVWPPQGGNPVDAGSKADFFDSMYHASAAVGINTTAQIEAGIVGRPVYSIRAREFEATQEGSLHFHYLLKECGGLVRLDDSLDAHVRSLAAALDGGDAGATHLRRFVEGFVRPRGWNTPATEVLADEIEALARATEPRQRPTAAERLRARLVRLALYPAAIAAARITPARRGSRESAER
ncbi:MAG TPA: hypothetical protein VL173_11170 [Vicinamibacterales bacterium]|nr:hypothetical protein [Vicinamibacterales bacterium]